MTQYISPEQRALILDLLNKYKGDYEKVAGQLGLSTGTVRWVDVVENKKFNYTPEGKGRPELQAYIVAIRCRETTNCWDNSNPRIQAARDFYDQGIVEITYGHDGLNLIMYAIPRREKITREAYFKLMEEKENVTV